MKRIILIMGLLIPLVMVAKKKQNDAPADESAEIEALPDTSEVAVEILQIPLQEMYDNKVLEIAEKNKEIAQLYEILDRQTENHNKEIAQLNAEKDELYKKLSNVAVNFLYIPYEQFSIDEIAIPAFEALKGSKYYDKYFLRLELLRSYADDIKALCAFLDNLDYLGYDIAFGNSLKEEAKEEITKLENTPTYKAYIQYEDWGNTYLGMQITAIKKDLVNITPDSKGKFRTRREQLSSLLPK